MKILIIGPPGSGKSTLAKKLAAERALHYLEIDRLKHGENWKPASKDELRQAVRKELSEDDWVVDGNYISTFGDEFINKADVVIWLDYSFPFVFQRLLRRTLKRTLMREELWNGNRESFFNNFFTNDSVIRYMVHNWKKQRGFYRNVFTESTAHDARKMIRVRRPRDLKGAIKF